MSAYSEVNAAVADLFNLFKRLLPLLSAEWGVGWQSDSQETSKVWLKWKGGRDLSRSPVSPTHHSVWTTAGVESWFRESWSLLSR